MAKPAKTATTTTRHALVVAGMHRSGTSAMARLLSLSGATLPERVMAPADDNPAGFWEPWEMVALNDRILASLESSWDDVFALGAAARAATVKSTYLGEARALVRANYGAADLLVIKDPRTSVLVPFWHEVLTDKGVKPVFVIMVRNPLAVAQSLAKRNGYSVQKSVLLWTSYMLAVERDTRGLDRVFISYDAMLEDWRSALSSVETALGQALPRVAADAAADIDGFLNHAHRHHEASAGDLTARADIWPGARVAFEWFEAAAKGKAPPEVALDTVAGEIVALESALGAVCADLRRERVALEAEAVAAVGLRDELGRASAALARLHGEADAARQAAEVAQLTARDQVSAAETLAKAVEAQLLAALRRAELAEEHGSYSEQRAIVAEERAGAAEERVAQTEQRAVAAEGRAEVAERLAHQQKVEAAAAAEASAAEAAILRQRVAAEQARAAIVQRSRDQAERELVDLTERLVALEDHAGQLEIIRAAQATDIHDLRHAVWAMQTSTSWRLTAPLRQLIERVRRR